MDFNLEFLLYAGKKLNYILETLVPNLLKNEGIKGYEIEKTITNYILSNNCMPSLKGYIIDNNMFMHSICLSINNVAIHGVPSNYIIKKEDIVKVDCVIKYKDFHIDAARTFFLGDDIKKKKFINNCNLIYSNIINFLFKNKNITTYKLAAYIEREISKNDFGNLDDFCGHHIGKEIHEEPLIYNSIRTCNNRNILLEGLFTIEPVIIFDKYFKYRLGKDNWSIVTNCMLTFHKEDTFLIDKNIIYKIT